MERHIGQLIKEQLERSGMKKTEFARRINRTSQNVYAIFERTSIDSALLASISEILNYNFFDVLAVELDNKRGIRQDSTKMPAEQTTHSSLIQALEQCEQKSKISDIQIGQLKKEVEYLKEINRLLREKRV
jgi:hypothetical protein